MNATEEWRQFADTKYQVSSLGRVKGLTGKILKPRPGAHGYLRISRAKGDGKYKDEYINRMVALTFIGPPPEPDWHADHIDRCNTNNWLTNIRWLSPEDNRALRVFQFGENHWQSKVTDEIVRTMRREPKRPKLASILGQKYGISREQARDILAGKSWRHVQ